MPTYHLLGIPHTRSHPDFSHCAFTNKVRTFPQVLRAAQPDARILHYGVGGGDEVQVPGAEHVTVLPSDRQHELLGHAHDDPARLVGNDANWDTPCYREFNRALAFLLESRVEDGDVILLPFGPAHEAALVDLRAMRAAAQWLPIEHGIGYPNPYVAARVYESSAWMHTIAGRQGHEGSDYHTVIPPWVIEEEWPGSFAVGPSPWEAPAFGFVGRQVAAKGAHVVADLARRLPKVRFRCAGQGNFPELHSLPNVEFVGALSGVDRARFYSGLLGVLCPSQFIEPGCQVSMEARVMGVPVIAPPRGVFLETITPGIDGYLPRSLAGWLESLDLIMQGVHANGGSIRRRALAQHSAASVGAQYAEFFRHAQTLLGQGWYANT